MNKDAPPAAANEMRDDIISRTAHRKSPVYRLFLGATLGMLIGILNFAAADNGWKLQQYFFNVVDAPIVSLIAPPYKLSGRPLESASAITDSWSVRAFLACYWMATGTLLASLFCGSNRRDT